MKHIMFANEDNEVVGITGCVEEFEPSKEFVAAAMSMGYTLLVGNLMIPEDNDASEILAKGDQLFSQAWERAKDIEEKLVYDI